MFGSKIEVEEIKIVDTDLPDKLSGKRVLIISDYHNTRYGKNNTKLEKLIFSLKCSSIIVAGDLFNGRGKNKHSIKLFDYLTANFQVHFCLGNHEENLKYTDDVLYNKIINSEFVNHYTLLNNSYVDYFGAKLYGINLSEEFYKRFDAEKINSKMIEKSLGKTNKECYNILVAHNPANETEYEKWGANLIISGHLHGGFIRLGNRGVITPQLKLFPKYTSGLYTLSNKCKLVISRGLGFHLINLRICNAPHLIVLDFCNKEDD